MPTYEYSCLKCKHQYEKREGFDAPALQKCPQCGGKAQRVIHAPTVVYKGSGFYITDSRKPAEKAETETSAESKTEKPSGTKADKKSSDSSSDSPSPAAETPAAS